MTTKIAGLLAAVGVILAAGSKVLQGEAPNWTEVMLAISVIAAAVGFQWKAPTPPKS